MRSMGKLAGAVPKSNSGRASGCTLPFSVVNCVSSIACVISGRGATAPVCSACCATTPAHNEHKMVTREKIERKYTFGADTETKNGMDTPRQGQYLPTRERPDGEEGLGRSASSLLWPEARGPQTLHHCLGVYNEIQGKSEISQ